MSNWDDPNAVKDICDAARKWGFFQIVNHGVPYHVLDDVKDATRKFFALPAEEKLKYTKEKSVTNSEIMNIKSSKSVVKKLLMILLNGLNVKEIDKAKESKLMGSKRINLNYYPKCPNLELTMGVGRGGPTWEPGGLYARNMDTMKWIHVPPVSGSLVINVGDALQIISNGKYKSVEHRVSANGTVTGFQKCF
ncbi:feruloyl CoA ortho-hydroxylase 1-like protein [Tanacetum coccineum]